MEQRRFLLAIVLSAAILFTWQYFFPQQEEPPAVNPPTATKTVENIETVPQPTAAQPQITPLPSAQDETAPRRSIVVETPLYKVTFDTRGAVPVSWILKKNKDNGKELFSVGAKVSQRQPLELISPEGLRREPREVPLRFSTGDGGIDAVLNERNFSVDGSGASIEDNISVVDGEPRRLTFVLRDAASGLVATKSFEFNANDYIVGTDVSVAREGGSLPTVEVAIGPSIGDQGINHYSFYSVAPEAVVGFDDGFTRHTASHVNDNENSPGNLLINRPAHWTSVGDTYFAMVAVPAQPSERVRLRTVKYENEFNGKKEDRYLISGYMPVPAAGLRTSLYVGPKDQDLLSEASAMLTARTDRQINLDGLIDYGYLSDVFRHLAIPILWSLKALNKFTHNYGLAIIVFTFIIYSLFFPLKWRSAKAMKKAQKFAPRLKELQEKMKTLKSDDPRLRELQMEQLRLMKEGNILGGCLPLLIQMPFFIALYKAITISLDFRQATFLWLPDLSASDPIHLLPVLMAASILVVQLITPAPTADPLQRKMMAVIMPAVMLFGFWSAPAGLLLYWLVGNIVTLSQQFIINRILKTDDDSSENEPIKQTLATT